MMSYEILGINSRSDGKKINSEVNDQGQIGKGKKPYTGMVLFTFK